MQRSKGGTTGHDDGLYSEFNKVLDGLEGEKREVVLCWDEINLVGSLAFKLIKGKYVFFGLCDRPHRPRLFREPKEKGKSRGEQLESMRASHALVFMATVLGNTSEDQDEKIIRRVVGVHSVRNCVAEEIDELFWDTVCNLREICDVRTVAGLCDGASANRLFQKANTSGQGRGMPNQFVTTVVPNDLEDDPGAFIFQVSDISHLIKKLTNHVWKMATRRAC